MAKKATRREREIVKHLDHDAYGPAWSSKQKQERSLVELLSVREIVSAMRKAGFKISKQ